MRSVASKSLDCDNFSAITNYNEFSKDTNGLMHMREKEKVLDKKIISRIFTGNYRMAEGLLSFSSGDFEIACY